MPAEQPFGEAAIAELFDLFPYEEDLPMYLRLAAEAGGPVLEVACGTGRVLLPLVRAGHRAVGLDASPHMLARAEAKLAGEPAAVAGRARLVRADMREFQLDEQFDLAYIPTKSFCYLTSRADQQRALACLAAHLRPGSRFVLDLLNPSPTWLLEPPGSLKQDLFRDLPEQGLTISRTETVVSTDLAAQVRLIRSAYELVAADGAVQKRYVEWPYRFIYRFEAEHLLERAGFEIEALYGGYAGEPFCSASRSMVFVARRV